MAMSIFTLLASATPSVNARPSGKDAYRQFAGTWDVTHRKLRDRLVGSNDWFEFPGTLRVDLILDGLGVLDENVLHDPSGSYAATTLRVFNPESGEWSVYWVDSRAPAMSPPVVGRATGNRVDLYGKDEWRGREIAVHCWYEFMSESEARWTQAFSTDSGASWEPNWIMAFRRASR